MAENGGALTSVLSRLSAHAGLLEQEVREIAADTRYAEECLRKYGECFTIPLGHLHELRRRKKALLLQIIERIEAVRVDFASAERCAAELDSSAPAPRPSCRPLSGGTQRSLSPTRLPTGAFSHSGLPQPPNVSAVSSAQGRTPRAAPAPAPPAAEGPPRAAAPAAADAKGAATLTPAAARGAATLTPAPANTSAASSAGGLRASSRVSAEVLRPSWVPPPGRTSPLRNFTPRGLP
eukprot:TRINITY_DN25731_c0_g1_i1.p2 TRINITY_DN25731_c0_g1~~TRINITY_DN25731_c0_g1_i1.p2  ORF type:complete len:250 (+),score=61.30 TRINITY_DN25731_c0_g1_i1:44-751(+)